MKWSERRVGLVVLIAASFATLLGASAPQQPLVVRNATAQGAVPSDCDKNLSDVPQTPRLEVAQMPMPNANVSTVALAPPSRELRAELEDLHRALTRNDRPAFDEHLAAARQIVAGYPSGAEKRGAEELVRVYTDTARLWDAQFASPFFDESSAEYDILKDYPGYADAVRRGMLTDDRDHRFYPAAESRAFLTRVAADRLARIGITTPRTTTTTTRVARAGDERRATSRPQVNPTRAPRSTSKAPVIASTKPRHTTPPHRTERTPVSSTPVTRTPTRVASEARPPVHEPAAAPAPAPAPPPITATTPITTTRSETSVVPPSDSTTMPPTETAVATTSSAPEPAAVAPPSPRRSMILPVILILVGLGVLILLFRAST